MELNLASPGTPRDVKNVTVVIAASHATRKFLFIFLSKCRIYKMNISLKPSVLLILVTNGIFQIFN